MIGSNRRIAGLLVLVCALVLVLLVPRVLDPGESGIGIRAPLPAPPAVGACLDDDDAGSGPVNWELGEISEVSCDLPHTYEVAKSWALDDPLSLPASDRPIGLQGDTCLSAVDLYIGQSVDLNYATWFRPLVNPTARLLQAPISEQINGYGWTACLVSSPGNSRYLGTVGGLARLGDRPSAFGLCRRDAQAVNCEQPHDEEVFGLTSGFEPFDLGPGAEIADKLPDRDVLQSQCEAMIQELLQRNVSEWSPVFLHLEITRDGQQLSRPDNSGVSVHGYLNYGECSLRVPTGQFLSDSLVSIGTGPLPLI